MSWQRSFDSLGFEVQRRPSDDYHHPRDYRYRQGEFSARGYYEDAFDHAAILRAVHEVSFPDTILLFEGVFLFRSELNPCWDYRILLDVDAGTSIERSVARDTGILGPREMVLRKCIERYEPAWLIYVARDDPEAKADIVIDNRHPAYPALNGRSLYTG